MDLEEVTNTIKNQSDHFCGKVKVFNESWDEILPITSGMNNMHYQNHCPKKRCETLLASIENTVQSSVNSLQSNLKNSLAEEKEKVKKLQNDLRKAHVELKMKEKVVEQCKNQEKITSNLCEKMEIAKVQIEMFKTLTGVSLNYQEDNTKGYVKTKEDIEVFEFNNKETSQETITKELWTLVE